MKISTKKKRSTTAKTAGGKSGSSRSKKTEKTRRTGLIVFLCAFFALILVGGIGAVVITGEINGGGSDTAEIAVSIPEGASTSAVAEALKDAGLISSRTVFKAYSKMQGADGTYQFGEKLLKRSMSYDEMIAELQKITIAEVETFTVTMPEGTTTLKFAIMLEDMGVCTRQEFVEVCTTGIFDVGFWDQISKDENKFITLEGYLFPDTYEFEVGSTLHDMVQMMLENFEDKVLTEERKAKIADSGYTLEEIIALSSIVEKESVGDESYPMVARAFFNRLNNPDVFPCLESDTSCNWRLRGMQDVEDFYGGYFPGVLQYYYGGYENVPAGTLEGYDTYSHRGIPIGAICNPGLKSIDGVLSPAEHNYFFFFTGEDKKTFYWSETADEHARQYAQYGPA